ncbi:MAG TPA: methyltransferase domain-containing protein [Anaerovoracaceae bacterium]|nr:methyltransferase domain-containing protein [Anaerovoracaceae bacterium]
MDSKYNSVNYQRDMWIKCLENHHGDQLYGYEWGDPLSTEARNKPGQILGNYRRILNDYLLPNIVGKKVVDIGCLGGKWVYFMKEAASIICVDLNERAFDHIKAKLPDYPLSFYKTSGDDLTGIPGATVDFVLSMDSLVRSETTIIHCYMHELKRVLKDTGKACLHLPCQDQHLSWELGFTPLSKAQIESMANSAGLVNFRIDTETVNHGILLLVNL